MEDNKDKEKINNVINIEDIRKKKEEEERQRIIKDLIELADKCKW